MSNLFRGSVFAGLLAAPIALAANSGAAPAKPAPAAARPAGEAEQQKLFTTEVMPLLQARCVSCHSGEKPQGNLRLTSRAAVLKGGDSGPAVSLKKPAESLILDAVNFVGRQMPPQGKLPQKEIAVFSRWIQAGLPWASGDSASLEPKGRSGPPQVTPENMKFWSFQPVRRPAVPAVKQKAWVRSPIDAFVLQRLEAAGLAPNAPASKVALLRRAYYDMIGLPPTPQEVQAFQADNSPKAWEKVVDRLLASPHYGEKWGRHWLDLVRFAESNSYERDSGKPNTWRYRDYVIKSFNDDKPYDQFMTEQIAGDELPERTVDRLTATGYYRLGIWDDEPVDREQALYDDLDDIANTTGQVFLGLTVGCARCHDHKLDPIPQKDYYRFLAFFNGLNRYSPESQKPIAPEAEIRKQRAEIEAHREKLRIQDEKISAVESRVLPDLMPVEKEDWRFEPQHVAIVKKRVPRLLSPDEFKSYLALIEERNQLRRFQPTALDSVLCVTEQGREARPTFVLMRGNAHVQGDRVEPGVLSILGNPTPTITPSPHGDSSGRRLALAHWLTSTENPLPARVMANRIWQYHFGRGIVKSSNNFGFQGDKPTHPELLDWLTSELTANGWHLKPLHKQILMSSAYQMSSQANAAALNKDPENNLFWRFDMRRLEAEEVRDSILSVNGSLNLELGGPSVFPVIPAEVLAGQSVPGAGWGKSTPEEERRRSVYIFVKRSLIHPLVASFDGPETDFTCPVRFSTTQPTQALGMLNSAFTNQQARVFADYLRKQAGPKPADQVAMALWRTLQRKPTAAEIARGVNLIASLQRDEKVSADDALAHFCLVAMNLNEFIYLD